MKDHATWRATPHLGSASFKEEVGGKNLLNKLKLSLGMVIADEVQRDFKDVCGLGIEV